MRGICCIVFESDTFTCSSASPFLTSMLAMSGGSKPNLGDTTLPIAVSRRNAFRCIQHTIADNLSKAGWSWGLRVGPQKPWQRRCYRFMRIQALTRQQSPLRIANFYWPKFMKSPRLIILSFAFAILALMLISCETGPDKTTTTTTTSQTAVTVPPPRPVQPPTGLYSRGGY
jgi:hypothetical protein